MKQDMARTASGFNEMQRSWPKEWDVRETMNLGSESHTE